MLRMEVCQTNVFGREVHDSRLIIFNCIKINIPGAFAFVLHKHLY